SEVGFILIDPEGEKYSYALRLNFANSRNDAEYEALLAGLRIAAKIKVEKMHAFVDSKLVASQVEGSYKAKSPQQARYLIKKIHMRSCGMHDGPRRAVCKAMNAGYFWPSMHRDANNEISSCDSCQVYATVSKLRLMSSIRHRIEAAKK
ncbi:reverse transcriptase domain-containing protein, partial [Tanacetum coccineum]